MAPLFTGSKYINGTADPYFQNVKLLLPMIGANNSTVVRDQSLNNRTITLGGNAKISTTQSKFSGSSLYLDGSSSYASIPYSSDFDISGNFTIETWFYVSGANNTLIGRRYSGTDGWVLCFNCLRANINSSWNDTQISWASPAVSTWHHIAMVKNGTTITIYLNGVSVGTKTSVTTIANPVTPLLIGVSAGVNNENPFTGYFNGVRLTQNVARYTSTFNPFNEPFPER